MLWATELISLNLTLGEVKTYYYDGKKIEPTVPLLRQLSIKSLLFIINCNILLLASEDWNYKNTEYWHRCFHKYQLMAAYKTATKISKHFMNNKYGHSIYRNLKGNSVILEITEVYCLICGTKDKRKQLLHSWAGRQGHLKSERPLRRRNM